MATVSQNIYFGVLDDTITLSKWKRISKYKNDFTKRHAPNWSFYS